ncbi:maleylpyruvate isomerase N-terminal domain-containing protein [Isoptericola jiangsuensis]|uniref:maleylpyruvate isomerase N-terminal domain-containing protein n=1 Tax=Isoptericola jiangsuensis TaxID=548579 RepID=UPI003AAEB68D
MSTSVTVDPGSGLRTDGGDDLDHLVLLAALQDRFAAGVAAADPGADVPACAPWTVRDLVLHVAQIHRWSAGQADPARGGSTSEAVPDDATAVALAASYRDAAADLHATLVRIDPGASCRTLLGQGPASFWRRRQVHETLVHLHDLRTAIAPLDRADGSEGAESAESAEGAERTDGADVLLLDDVRAEIWADGVDEVVTMFQPRQVRLGRSAPLARTVRLHAHDLDRSWTLGAHEDDRPSQDPAATVRATARTLDLLLWRRTTLADTDVEVSGDGATLHAVLAAPIVP